MLETHCILACFSISIKVISVGPKEEQREGSLLLCVFCSSMRCWCAVVNILSQLQQRINGPLGTRLGAGSPFMIYPFFY